MRTGINSWNPQDAFTIFIRHRTGGYVWTPYFKLNDQIRNPFLQFT